MDSKSEIVSKYIEKLIINGELAPNSKIPSEVKLAEELGVSRVSVRAGIAKLSAMGLLLKKKGGGTYVKKFEANNYLFSFLPTMMFNQIDYLEMLEFRSALDSLSIELCIKNSSDEFITQIKNIVLDMEKNINSDGFFEFDKKFHLVISKNANNSLIHNINLLIWDILEKHAKNQYKSIDNNRRIIEHKLILETIINNDIELAKIYSDRHLKRTIDDIRKVDGN